MTSATTSGTVDDQSLEYQKDLNKIFGFYHQFLTAILSPSFAHLLNIFQFAVK